MNYTTDDGVQVTTEYIITSDLSTSDYHDNFTGLSHTIYSSTKKPQNGGFTNITSVSVDEWDVEDPESFTVTQKVWIALALGFASFVIVAGNVMTIAVYVKDPKIRSIQNMYIVNLAVTDLLIGLSSVPFYALYTILKFKWILGYSYCKIWSLVDYWVCAESSLAIILISYDRFQMVSQGAQYLNTQSKTKSLILIAATWLISFLIYGPAIIGYNHWRGFSTVEDEDCDVEFAEEFAYTVFTAFLEFCIPFTLLVLFSSLLYRNIRQRNLKVLSSRKVVVATITEASNNDKASKENILRKDKKAAKSLAILVSVYAVCWIPYTISTIVNSLCDGCVLDIVHEPVTWLLWFNSGLNPILYAVTNRQFRKHFQRMLCTNTRFFTFHDKVFPTKTNSTHCDSPEPVYSV